MDDKLKTFAERSGIMTTTIGATYSYVSLSEALEIFAYLVRQDEREACVKLLEESADLPNLTAHNKFEMYLKIFMQRVADQIRAKG